MKKQMKKMAAVLAGLSIACTCLPVAAFAAGAPQYNVVFSAGECGTIASNQVQCAAGDITSPAITVKDSDLYVANEFYCADTGDTAAIDQSTMKANVSVTGDAIYVAQYIAANSALTCTVQYVDASGVEVAPSKSYRVQSGKSVAEAAATIDGYTYGSADYSVNGGAARAYSGSVSVTDTTAIVFHYTANTNVITNTVTTTNTTYTDNVTTVGAVAAAPGAAAGTGAGAGGAAGTTIPDNETPLAGGSSSSATDESASAASSRPSETITDNEVPQAASAHSVNVAMVIGVIAAAVVAVVGIIVFIWKKKSAHQG